MVAAKDAHALTSYFIKKYKAKYGVEPVVNRHAARWGFADVLTGMSADEAKELVDFYFTTASATRHNLDWFLYNYHKLIIAGVEAKKDAERRAKLREESAERAREWRRRGNQGITNN